MVCWLEYLVMGEIGGLLLFLASNPCLVLRLLSHSSGVTPVTTTAFSSLSPWVSVGLPSSCLCSLLLEVWRHGPGPPQGERPQPPPPSGCSVADVAPPPLPPPLTPSRLRPLTISN